LNGFCCAHIGSSAFRLEKNGRHGRGRFVPPPVTLQFASHLGPTGRLRACLLEAATFLMSMFFLIGGLYQFFYALWTQLPGYGWQALNGAVSSVLGFLLLAQWSVSGLYAIGLFVGIDLLFYGWAWIALALDLRKM
jgi:hypothetical protein